jgi:hypothetical protein
VALLADKNPQANPQNGPESHTDTGRAVYGGGGISPDEAVKPGTISGRTTCSGCDLRVFIGTNVRESPRIRELQDSTRIEFDHDLAAEDYPVTDPLFKELKKFGRQQDIFKVTPEQLDHLAVRGATTSLQRLVCSIWLLHRYPGFQRCDPQVARAVDAMPRARELALAASRVKPRG